MKKILYIVLCLVMAILMTLPVLADEEVVMTVTYTHKGEDKTQDWSVFHDGWTDAMKKAKDSDYSNVTVTLKKDWLSDDDGQFTPDTWNKEGFNWDAIDFPKGCNITVDLNGYSINRKLKDDEFNGEVMCVNSGATVTIKNGSIMGGNSKNGAGGIHMKGGTLILLDVHVKGNRNVAKSGAGIAVLGGELIMKGGSIAENTAEITGKNEAGAGIGILGGKVSLDGVKITKNKAVGSGDSANGGGVAILRGSVELKNCEISLNIADNCGGGIYCSGIENSTGKVTAENCDISSNLASYGGGIYAKRGSVSVKNSNIHINRVWVKKDSGEAMSVYTSGGGAGVRVSGCYIEGTVYDKGGRARITGKREDPIDLSNNHAATMRSYGYIAIIVGVVAVAVATAVAVVLYKKKKKKKKVQAAAN